MERCLVALTLAVFVLTGCVHSFSMHSADGKKLDGKYRFAREGTGLMQVRGSDGEILSGRFVRVDRAGFVENYQKTFGRGSIAVDGPDLFSYGNVFDGIFPGSKTLMDSAYGETFNKSSAHSGITVSGLLFYWTASLQGNRGTTLGCYLIGSSYTGHGVGRCKSQDGKEYTVEF